MKLGFRTQLGKKNANVERVMVQSVQPQQRLAAFTKPRISAAFVPGMFVLDI